MPAKHYSHLVFRAVENRVATIKADIGFDSAIIDPYGRILALTTTSQLKRAIFIADIPLSKGKPPVAVYLGDTIGWLALMAAVGFLAMDLITARRAQ
ncbi:hypothetical protein [Moorella sulfitireducens (nom. illeg.)]|uniref:hypothetical protein n=1 Tax=Neomoorella sulfitireducens TaxID=2972948 RepID=UPI0021AD042F|nr:hypothetical protein [Moorella sulfitireducens]